MSTEWEVITGDCLEVMRGMDAGSVDAVVTDPPAGISFMGKEWDGHKGGRAAWVEWMTAVMVECLRVLKPGGHALVWALPRTAHWTACAVEDAGFEIRDKVYHLFGSGFPKSLDIGKAIDKMAGVEREVTGISKGTGKQNPAWNGTAAGRKENSLKPEFPATAPATPAAVQWDGWHTALKPAVEEWILARKPLEGTVAANVLKHGTGGLNVGACRVGSTKDVPASGAKKKNNGYEGGWGGGQGRENGTGFDANIGRYPAHLIHDGSPEVLAGFPTGRSAGLYHKGAHNGSNPQAGSANIPLDGLNAPQYNDTGSAARFFYCAPQDALSLLFCRAKAIMGAWNQDLANTADSFSPLLNERAASVLSDAVTVVSRGASLLSDVTGLSTTVTPNELRLICETLITAILSLESAPLPGQSLDVPIPNGCLVSVAATPGQTDTTTITISPPRLGGFVESATFSITPASKALGGTASPSRIKYCAKASRADRDEGNLHPTVKASTLMRYLCRLITPPGSVILDPFAGSGSTGKGAVLEGFRFVGIEQDEEYADIARARIARAAEQARQAELPL